tara:strand:+ start:609 stop:833 length:225 start_codon:yes stop_codon:yes gene_type:complete
MREYSDAAREFKVGDYVMFIEDGDIGVVVEIDDDPTAPEPYNIEWHFEPNQSGWHCAYRSEWQQNERLIVRFGG